MSDIDIARAAKKIHIRDVAAKVNIPEENLYHMVMTRLKLISIL